MNSFPASTCRSRRWRFRRGAGQRRRRVHQPQLDQEHRRRHGAKYRQYQRRRSGSVGGTLAVAASDTSTIDSLAGAIAIAGIGAEAESSAAGASVAYDYLGGDPNDPLNTDGNTVTAAIENVTGPITVGQLNLDASNSGIINNITLGGAARARSRWGDRCRSTGRATCPRHLSPARRT